MENKPAVQELLKLSTLELAELLYGANEAYNELEESIQEMVNGWNEEREALEKEIKRLREKLKYAYNKAYILYHSHKSSDVRADIRKLFYSVEEFEHIKGEGK
jgi:hypothetical protein